MQLKDHKRIISLDKSVIFFNCAVICFVIHLSVRCVMGSFYTPKTTTSTYFNAGGNIVGTSAWFLGWLFSFLLGVLETRNYNNKYKILMFLSILPAIVWTVIDIHNGYTLNDVFGSTTLNPLTFLMFLTVYAGLNEKIWERCVRVCRTLSVFLIFGSLVYTIIFLTQYGSKSISYSPQIILLSQGFWLLAVRAIATDNTKRDITAEFLILITFACSVLYNSRGWIIQTVLLLFMYIYFHRIKLFTVKGIIAFISIVVAIVVGYHLVMTYMPDRVTSLMLKFATGSQSRTWQYDLLFDQYSFTDFIFGKGSFASYETTTYGTFMYFDNTFMNLIMKFGLLTTICTLVFLIVPLGGILKKGRSERKEVASVLFLFFLAMIGFSVYCDLNFDLKFLIVCVLIGRYDYLKTDIRGVNCVNK